MFWFGVRTPEPKNKEAEMFGNLLELTGNPQEAIKACGFLVLILKEGLREGRCKHSARLGNAPNNLL